jgi:hypothetical protein
MLCEYGHSSINRVLEKIIPLLEYFSEKEIYFTSFEERIAAQQYFPSTILEEFKNVTLIVDTTPLPIQHHRNDPTSGQNGVWDGAHKMWGNFFLLIKAKICKSNTILLNNFVFSGHIFDYFFALRLLN